MPRPEPLEIQRVLVLSTAHLRRETADEMEEPDGPKSIFCDEIRYGYLVKVQKEREPSLSISDELWACMKFARSKRCPHIRFDQDGSTVSDLPSFNW
ncbi:MAG: hypothetical protein IT581_20105 [Verrucomicrobiales bacterium]|nr:hypothetical protein [Verrucomicrobiales bacterium]